MNLRKQKEIRISENVKKIGKVKEEFVEVEEKMRAGKETNLG